MQIRKADKITEQSFQPHGAIAQLGERIVRNDEVVGSIPTSSTNHFKSMRTQAFRGRLGQQAAFMTLEEFQQSLKDTEPPVKLTPALTGLWWDAKGDWTRAHESAQEDKSRAGSWVHAYLHRKEGDTSNAAYWYSRAGQAVYRESLESEWLSIVRTLLADDQ